MLGIHGCVRVGMPSWACIQAATVLLACWLVLLVPSCSGLRQLPQLRTNSRAATATTIGTGMAIGKRMGTGMGGPNMAMTISSASSSPKLIIAGAPAAGKGTQCEALASKYGVVHLSTGDMLRAAVKAQTLLGQTAQKYMDSGKLVPDDLIIDIVKNRLAEADCRDNGWLLDGFPRTEAQAEALTKQGLSPDCVILLDVPESVLVERVAGRRLDPVTGKVYHTVYNPPTNNEVAERLIQRSDDTEEKVKARFKDFEAHIESIKACYENKIVTVDGTRPKEEITACLLSEIDRVLASAAQSTKANPRKCLNIIIAGAPAAGKGTQCEFIKAKYGVVHLSTGDILRAAVATGTELGTKAKEYMDGGKLVPDDLIIGVVRERLAQPDCADYGWLLDGFPRTSVQADALQAAGLVPDCCLLLDVPEEVLVERVEGRRLDPVTGKLYHMKFSPPPTEEIARRLTQRSDDTAEKVRVRYRDFTKHASSIELKYKDRLFKIDGTKQPKEVSASIGEILDKVCKDKDQNGQGNSKNGLTKASKASSVPDSVPQGLAMYALGVSFFIILDQLVGRLLKSIGSTFPSSLAGMVLVFMSMLVLHSSNAPVSRQVLSEMLPSVSLIRYWLPVFFVPSLVMFPLRFDSISANLLPLLLLTIVGFVGSLITTAVVADLIPGKKSVTPNEEEKLDSPISAPPLKMLSAMVAATATCGAIAHYAGLTALSSVFEIAAGLFATLCGVTLGRGMPKQAQSLVHPIVSCTLFTIGVLKLYAAVLQQNLGSVLKRYQPTPTGLGGAGSLLSSMLAPSVVSFGILLYQYRSVLFNDTAKLLCSTFFAAVFGLFSSAFMCRSLNIATPEIALATLTRCITTPLALSASSLLQSDPTIAVTIVALTGVLGANLGVKLLSLFRLTKPVTVGVAMGASAHGLGSAAVSSDPKTFAASIVSMVLTGFFTVLLTTIMPCRTMLTKIVKKA